MSFLVKLKKCSSAILLFLRVTCAMSVCLSLNSISENTSIRHFEINNVREVL